MSERFVQIKLNFITNSDFTPTQKLIYIMLKSYAWDGKSCFPSTGAIAEALGLSVSTVRNALKKFRECGLIKVENRLDNYGRSMSNLYLLEPESEEETAEKSEIRILSEKECEQYIADFKKREREKMQKYEQPEEYDTPFRQNDYLERRRL